MGFKKEDLQKAEHPLYGFNNKRIEALEKIDVNMNFGHDATMRTEVITFDVIDFVYHTTPSSGTTQSINS
jgi:hypothetical protein